MLCVEVIGRAGGSSTQAGQSQTTWLLEPCSKPARPLVSAAGCLVRTEGVGYRSWESRAVTRDAVRSA